MGEEPRTSLVTRCDDNSVPSCVCVCVFLESLVTSVCFVQPIPLRSHDLIARYERGVRLEILSMIVSNVTSDAW